MKTFAIFEEGTFNFVELITVRDNYTSLLATEHLPSKAALKALDEGSIKTLTFDPKNEKWRNVQFSQEEIDQAIREATLVVNSAIEEQFKRPFVYKQSVFSIGIVNQFKYYDVMLAALLGIAEFPIEMTTKGAAFKFQNTDDIKDFFKAFTTHKQSIVAVGRILKSGGEIAGKAYKPLSSYSPKKLLDHDLMEETVKEAFALWEESKTNAKA